MGKKQAVKRNDIKEIKKVRSIKDIQAEMAKGFEDLDRDPQFVADYLKGQFVEDVLRAMEQNGVTRNELARRIGKSRQYIGRILNERANFTIETMSAISCALNGRLTIRMFPGQTVRAMAPAEMGEGKRYREAQG